MGHLKIEQDNFFFNKKFSCFFLLVQLKERFSKLSKEKCRLTFISERMEERVKAALEEPLHVFDHKERHLESVMNQYGNSIVKLAYSYVKDFNIAEDISQEVFITYFNNLDIFRGESSVKTYLYRITINKCKDYLKSWNYRKVKITEMFGRVVADHTSTPEQPFLEKEHVTDLADFVLALPLKYREVVFLFYYEVA
ncbi:sigma-70 family RNA polymerase sigma factor [Sutcliffiella horikoshii]|uniref:sigma-70 family RNA polymerase sigma factor n=1 Tax=Sutcliffiella horikoshii TaxID=79883 RepID=UPI00384AD156